MKDDLGDIMKALEAAAEPDRLSPDLPLYARIDGRRFSRFTRGMQRPFDQRMTDAMIATAAALMQKTHACAAYTQSDEISLAWDSPDGADMFFGGRPLKIASVLSGLATASFMQTLLQADAAFSAFAQRLPHFDARVMNMPDRETVAQMISWRGQDARRNGINQLARAHFSHKDLQGVSSSEITRMLQDAGHLPQRPQGPWFNGTLIYRTRILSRIDDLLVSRASDKARPALAARIGETFQRSVLRQHDSCHPGMIPNLVDVIFTGADPLPHRMSIPAAAR